MDRQNIRDRMQNVFGTYNDFLQTLSTSSNNLTRHGVLQTPTTPVTARAPVFPARPQSPAVAPPSVRECVQVMSDLVSSPPLQPPQLSFHRNSPYLNPASSTRSSPDESEAKKKKRKHKNHESDSEVEKRKRPKDVPSELAKPSTSQEKPQDDDAMKELFGDDTSKPGGSDKGVSPDSGVHSTENEGNEDFDINTIVSTMSNLLPMLSPPLERPLAKQRNREKEERRRREHEEQKAREREEKAREREEKAREEARRKMEEERRVTEEKERERKAVEERERKQAEEKERKEREKKAAAEKRMAEEREKKLAEEREKEERRERKAAEEREKKQAEEKERKEREKKAAEEREKKQAEEREKERIAVEEKEKKQAAEEKERRKADERRKAEEEKKKMEEKASSSPANQPLTEASNRISGVLPLHLLSSDKMSKLLDLGRKSGKMDLKSEKRPKSPLVTAESAKKRKEREEPANEGESSKKSVKNEIKNEPESSSSPRPGSSLSGKEFRCACNEVIPSKPVRAQIPSEKKDENLQNLAKSLKRKADQTPDQVRKILLYLDSIVYFALGARFLNYQEKVSSRKASIFRETADLAKQTTSRFAHSDSLTPLQHHFVSRIRSLSIRVQSVLLYNLYNAKSSNTLRTYQMIEQGEDQITINKGDEATGSDGKTSSPGGSSVHSSSNQAPSGGGTVTMPLDHYQLHRSQMKMLHNLMWAHKLWQDADHMAHNNPTDTQFINSLESLCGSLSMMTPVEKISTFFLTGISWLRDEYEAEMRRPPPPPPKSKSS